MRCRGGCLGTAVSTTGPVLAGAHGGSKRGGARTANIYSHSRRRKERRHQRLVNDSETKQCNAPPLHNQECSTVSPGGNGRQPSRGFGWWAGVELNHRCALGATGLQPAPAPYRNTDPSRHSTVSRDSGSAIAERLRKHSKPYCPTRVESSVPKKRRGANFGTR